MSSIPAHLLTPRDWQAEAVAHAARECGTPEGRRALAEAARYGALADRLAELQAEIERITEAGRAHIRRAAAFETQRDELADWKAKIEAQPPVAWQSRFTDGGGWGNCSERHAQMVEAAPHEWPGYEVRALFARQAPSAAPVQAEQKACRDDGRCQYAIDHGAEGLGHCPPGKCVMPCEGGAA